MDKRTWITEVNAFMAATVALLIAFGVPVPPEAMAPIAIMVNVMLRIASKKGWM